MRCKRRGNKGKGKRGFKVNDNPNGYGDGRNVFRKSRWEKIERVGPDPIQEHCGKTDGAVEKRAKQAQSDLDKALARALKGGG